MGIIEDVLATKKLEDLQVTKSDASSDPELTSDNVNEAIVLLKEVEKNNGHIAIAQSIGLTQKQVAEIHDAMNIKISELTPKEAEGI